MTARLAREISWAERLPLISNRRRRGSPGSGWDPGDVGAEVVVAERDDAADGSFRGGERSNAADIDALALILPPAVKKPVVNSSRKAIRSLFTPSWNPAILASSRPPSGLSSDLYRRGGEGVLMRPARAAGGGRCGGYAWSLA